eukprot:s3075_g5.t2
MGAVSASQHHAGRGDPMEHRMKRLFPGSKWLAAAAGSSTCAAFGSEFAICWVKLFSISEGGCCSCLPRPMLDFQFWLFSQRELLANSVAMAESKEQGSSTWRCQG